MRVSPFQRLGQRRFITAPLCGHRAFALPTPPTRSPAKLFHSTAPVASAAAPATPSADRVWELWSEGNLFALSIPELQAFLRAQGVPHIDPTWRKSTLVKQVDEIVSSMRSLSTKSVRGGEVVPQSTAVTASDSLSELTAEGVFDAPNAFVDVQQGGLYSGGDAMGPIIPRAFQLMHASLSPDVVLSRVNTSQFPGGNSQLQAYTLLPTGAANSNRGRFSKAFQWCVLNLWNMSMDGEMHLSVGRMLFWKGSNCYPRAPDSAERRNMTLWSAQQQLQAHQPYTWVSIAAPESRPGVEEFLEQNAYRRADPGEAPVETYRVSVKRQNREVLEGEVSGAFETTALSPSWERFLLTFYVRDAMPDVRIQLRARLPLKKKTAELFAKARLIKAAGAKVAPALTGDLGEVLFVTKRSVKTWKRTIDTLKISLFVSEIASEVVYASDPKNKVEGRRLEYEMRCTIPQQSETVDLAAISEEIWDSTLALSKTMEAGMQAFQCAPKPAE